jgi:hypothetical protein
MNKIKVKLSLSLLKHHTMKMYTAEMYPHAILSLEKCVSASCCFAFSKRATGTNCTSLRASLDTTVVKTEIPDPAKN